MGTEQAATRQRSIAIESFNGVLLGTLGVHLDEPQTLLWNEGEFPTLEKGNPKAFSIVAKIMEATSEMPDIPVDIRYLSEGKKDQEGSTRRICRNLITRVEHSTGLPILQAELMPIRVPDAPEITSVCLVTKHEMYTPYKVPRRESKLIVFETKQDMLLHSVGPLNNTEYQNLRKAVTKATEYFASIKTTPDVPAQINQLGGIQRVALAVLFQQPRGRPFTYPELSNWVSQELGFTVDQAHLVDLIQAGVQIALKEPFFEERLELGAVVVDQNRMPAVRSKPRKYRDKIELTTNKFN